MQTRQKSREKEMLEGAGPRSKKERDQIIIIGMGGMMAGTMAKKPVPEWRFRCAR
jgi:hypothetical protein